MQHDKAALNAKRDWLIEIANTPQLNLPSEQIEHLISNFAQLTAPEMATDTISFITINSLSHQATSTKPGNLILNWRKLFEAIPETVIAGVETAKLDDYPWMIAFVALHVWNIVKRGAEEQLTEVEACILHALWKNRNKDNKVEEKAGLAYTNELRQDFGQPSLSHIEYARSLTRLAQIKCVELTDGVVWLREWTRVTYR